MGSKGEREALKRTNGGSGVMKKGFEYQFKNSRGAESAGRSFRGRDRRGGGGSLRLETRNPIRDLDLGVEYVGLEEKEQWGARKGGGPTKGEKSDMAQIAWKRTGGRKKKRGLRKGEREDGTKDQPSGPIKKYGGHNILSLTYEGLKNHTLSKNISKKKRKVPGGQIKP